MVPVKCYEDLAPLLSAQLKRGVVTNNFLSRSDWEREWESGVRVHQAEGCLVLLRSRPSHDILNVYLHAGAVLSLPQLTRPTVVELVWRQRDAEAVQAAAAQFVQQGFALQVHRLRSRREPAAWDTDGSAKPASPDRLPAVLGLMERCFDPRTGCIPSAEVLAEDTVLCTWDGETLTGLLHYRQAKTGTELRHLAVRADRRGSGIGAMLVESYLQRTGQENSLVWTAKDNTAARHLYEKYGYRPDGWESVVLMAGGKDTL